ncbi:hypothetical protein ACI8HA_003622 [Vibrio cholerae]
MVTVVVLSLVVVRCQPLRRALVSLSKNHQKFTHKVLKIQPLSFKLHNLAFGFWLLAFGFWFFSDADLVERVERSAVSKSLITNKL